MTLEQTPLLNRTATSANVTLFAQPKPFVGHIGIIQRNAITSWTRLRPQPQVLLFGQESGTAELAAELGVRHIPEVECNEWGTPLVSSLFRQAHDRAEHALIAYLNSDIILLDDFVSAVAAIHAAELKHFLMIGRRIDSNITELLDFDGDWQAEARRAAAEGQLAARVCKDFFLYRRGDYADIPPFAVGRACWDNWMVYHAHQAKFPVIDATRAVTAIHQDHSYTHLAGGRRAAYSSGAEAQRNEELAGGKHLRQGSAANWVLTPRGLRRARVTSGTLQFLADLRRFGQLIGRICRER